MKSNEQNIHIPLTRLGAGDFIIVLNFSKSVLLAFFKFSLVSVVWCLQYATTVIQAILEISLISDIRTQMPVFAFSFRQIIFHGSLVGKILGVNLSFSNKSIGPITFDDHICSFQSTFSISLAIFKLSLEHLPFSDINSITVGLPRQGFAIVNITIGKQVRPDSWISRLKLAAVVVS